MVDPIRCKLVIIGLELQQLIPTKGSTDPRWSPAPRHDLAQGVSTLALDQGQAREGHQEPVLDPQFAS